MSDLTRQLALSVRIEAIRAGAVKLDPYAIKGDAELAAYAVALERGMPWREAALHALSVNAR